jgi:hypothetical protein
MLNRPNMQTAVFGGVIAGGLDLLYAFVAYGLLGVAPLSILHSIASGFLGKSAYQGGLAAASLGLVSHFAICIAAAGLYGFVARRVRGVARQPWIAGPCFGLGMFAVMNYVVVPLSAAVVEAPSGKFLIGGLLVHMFGVGLPIAWMTSGSINAAGVNATGNPQ